MSEPKTAWVVSRGSYSDYRVLCVCDSKERAEVAAALLDDGYEAAFVEELPYLDHEPERYVIHGIEQVLWDDGRTDEQRISAVSEWEHDALYPDRVRPVSWRWVRAPMYQKRGGRLEVHGTDLERVRRVFSDKRAEIQATDVLRLREEAHS